MAPVVWALRARPEAIAVRLVFTGQHRELASDLFTPLAMEPDLALGVMTEDQSLTAVGARCLQAIGHALEQDAPALLLVQGDTSTVLFSALAAYFQKVAIGHVEAGLRSFNKYAPFPEEAMRRLTDAVADLPGASQPQCPWTGYTAPRWTPQRAARGSAALLRHRVPARALHYYSHGFGRHSGRGNGASEAGTGGPPRHRAARGCGCGRSAAGRSRWGRDRQGPPSGTRRGE